MSRSLLESRPGFWALILVVLPFLTAWVPDGRTGADRAGGNDVRVERAWPLMGTFLRVSARATDSAAAGRAVRAARAAVARVDSLMSTYRPDSEISSINRRAGSGRWTRVSPETLEVLQTSLHWARASEGALDPTVGPLMKAWGFRGGDLAPPSATILDSILPLVDYRRVEVDSAGSGVRVRLAEPGMALDFGAVAKGYALDRALDALRGQGARAGMVDLGGNVAVFGPPPGGGEEWVLGIRHPRAEGRLLGTVVVEDGSVSTSGDYEQALEAGGVRYGHILDPRTGRPARGVAAVTVSAGDGVTADVVSTLLFVLGPDAGRRLLERVGPEGGVTALWVRDPSGKVVHRELIDVVEGRSGSRFEIDLPAPDSEG